MIDLATLREARERASRVADTWRRGAEHRMLRATLDGEEVEQLAAAAEMLLADDGWVERLLAPLIAALAADPWFEPPFRVHRDGLRTAAVLLDTGSVSLVASGLSADALTNAPRPATVVLSGRVAVTRYVKSGGARLLRWQGDRVTTDFATASARPIATLPAIDLTDGLVLRHDGRTDGHLIVNATADMAMLTVTIRPGAAPFMREYDRASGALMRVAMIDEAAARTQMLLTLLRVSGHADAGGAFEAATRDPAFFLRWSAMREWLALDVRRAMPRLAEMAREDPNAEIRTTACGVLAQIASMREVACHA